MVAGASLEEKQKEVDNILDYAKDKSRLKLGIGVSDTESLDSETEKDNKRFDDQWIFLSIDNKGRPGRTITINFNNINDLTYFADRLVGLFDEIVLDYSTYKFAFWNKNHLEQFSKLLKKGGTFTFPPEGQFDMLSGLTFDEFVEKSKEKIQGETARGELSRGYPILYPPIIREGMYEDDINNAIRLYQEAKIYLPQKFSRIPRENIPLINAAMKTLKENGIELPYGIVSQEDIENEALFRKKIARQVNVYMLDKLMWEENIPEWNIKPLLSSYFQDVSITPIGQGILPIPGHENFAKDSILVTATK